MKQILITLFLFPIYLMGQELHPAPAASVHVSAERLARVDELIQSSIDKGWLPGGVFLMARKGTIVYHKSFGEKAPGIPYKNDDIFRIASMTKAVTVVGIMQLYEKGLLGLDDPLHWYLPAYKDLVVLDTYNETDSTYTTIPATRHITIRHLLTHTSGITYGEFNPGKLMAVYKQHDMLGVGLSHSQWTTEEFIDRLANVPLAFEPGEKYLYGLNMDVLGRVIEVVSGSSLADYFQEQIFSKLGMKDTYFYLPRDRHSRLVPVFTVDEAQKFITAEDAGLIEHVDYPIKKGVDHYAGGGGLSSTTMDYARFIQMLLNDGVYNGNRLLNPQTIDLIKADQLIQLNRQGNGFSDIPGVSFGLGFTVYAKEAEGLSIKSPGTYEWAGYFNTKFFIDPQEQLIFVGMTQVVPYPFHYFWDRLYAVLYGSLEE